MDCKHARMLLEVAHPIATELEASEKAALASHLADCPDCGYMAEAERRVDEKFGAAVRDVAVPEGLKERIGRRLQGERDAWWRVRVVRVAGAAAAVLLVCWVSYAVWFSKRPVPDLQALLGIVDQRETGPKIVEQVFSDMGVNMRAPRGFDYTNLRAYHMAVFPDNNKKVVPYLLFERQEKNGTTATAQVYVLSDQAFDIEAIRNLPPLAGSHQNIAVRVDKDHPHVVFVVIYTGASLDLFFKVGPIDA
jgi:hypothetical protein